MEELQNAWEFIQPHWAGLSWAVMAMIVGQVMKNAVFTKDQAHKKRKSQWFWWWMRKTLALHPVIAGCIVGLVWHDPVEGADWPWIGSVIYFGFFGAISTWLFEVIKGLAKKRGIELNELGKSTPPPAEGSK